MEEKEEAKERKGGEGKLSSSLRNQLSSLGLSFSPVPSFLSFSFFLSFTNYLPRDRDRGAMSATFPSPLSEKKEEAEAD